MQNKCFNKLLIRIFLTAIGFMSTYVAADTLAKPQLVISSVSKQLKQKIENGSFGKDNKNFAKISMFVENIINPHVDFNRISALVLGKLWKQATKDEKIRFTKEFKRLLIRVYSRIFFEFKDWSLQFLPLNILADNKKIIVKTKILQPDISSLSVSYRMILIKGHWKIYDIMFEGISLVTNYRNSIKNEFKKSGSLETVIAKLAKSNARHSSTKNN